MSRVYATFKDVLTRNKDNPVAPAGIKDTQASGLNGELNAFEQMVTQNIERLKATIKQREETVKKEAQDAERVFAALRENITMLENKLEETVNTARMKESASQKLEENLTGKIRGLEEELTKNQKTLQSRDAEINDLKSQLQLLARGVKEMSSFFKQAEALASLDQPSRKEVAKEPTNRVEEKPAGAELKGPVVVKSKAADTTQQKVPPDFLDRVTKQKVPPNFLDHVTQQKVPPDFFDRVTHELTQSIGPMAPMIIHDHVKALGESMEKFPNSRVRELLDILSKEILDVNGKARFRMYFAKQMREGGA